MRIAATSARVALFCGLSLPFGAIDNAVGNCPLHCICCIGANGSCIREAVELAVCLRRAGIAVHHGNELLAGDVGVRVRTIGHALSLCPLHTLLVPGSAAGGVLACVACENRHQHCTGRGCARRKLVAARAAHQTLVGNVLDRVNIPVAGLDVRERLALGLTAVVCNEGRDNRYLALRHNEGELAVALVRHFDGIALCVGNRQLVELVAVLCLYGNSNRAALGSRGLVDRNRTVIRLGSGNRGARAGGRAPPLLE